MTIAISTEGNASMLAIDITGVASVAAAGQGSLANPFGCSVHIVRAWLLVKTQATAAGQLQIGVTTAAAAAADVWPDTAMNGQTEGSLYSCFAQDPGAATVLVPAVWTAAKYLTFSGTVASLVGFTGTLFLEIVRTPAE